MVQVTEAIGKVAAAYGVNAMQGTLMHQMKRSVRLRFVLGTSFCHVRLYIHLYVHVCVGGYCVPWMDTPRWP